MKITSHENGVSFPVRVQPRASRSEIAGEIDGAIKIRLAAPPVDGEANEELIRFLAKRLGVSRAQITLLSGQTSKNKVIKIEGISASACEQLLQ